jgi:hypothetical protein
VCQRTASSIINILRQNGVIECVDENYQFTGRRKGKTYRLR